jgi:uncharacterized OB-fold protein/acyl dehydratase
MPDRALEQAFAAFVGQPFGPPDVGRDAVNEPMIRQWCDAMGDRNPIYWDAQAAAKSAHKGLVAPPTMLQAWILSGFRMANADRPPSDKQEELHALFNQHGYTGVVATNCEQEYTRYLRPGERVTAEAKIESISEEKTTALGVGYFIVTRTSFRTDSGEDVGSMIFRVLKFKPAQQPAAQAAAAAPAKPGRIPPLLGKDNGWWWEQGVAAGEILIQKCSACGALRHPPRPMCPECQSTEWGSVPSAGSGSVHSFVVMHHPPMPGYDFPAAIGLIDLDEGTRLVAPILDCAFEEIHIGMKVEASVEELGGVKMPVFRRAGVKR